jgi:hypothetical protein
VSSKEGTFFEESGHDSQEKNSVNFWPKYFFVVGGRTVWIRTIVRIWHRNRGNFWHSFLGDFQIFDGCFWVVQRTMGTKTRYERGRTTIRFWHGKRGRFLWDRFGAVRYFPWLEMLFCY